MKQQYKHRILCEGPWTYDGYATQIHEYLFPHGQSVYIRVLEDFNHWLEASKYPTMAQSINLEAIEASVPGRSVLITALGVHEALYEPETHTAKLEAFRQRVLARATGGAL